MGGVLALIILGTVALVVVAINNRPDETVMKYFEALQAGNAEEAISYARYQPEDTTLLTDEVLQKSNELGGITDVEITRSSNDRVTVSMRINGSTETGYYKVAKTDDGWKLDEVAWNLGMSRMGEKAPLFVNGVEVTDPTSVVVFPGVYELTTGTDNVAWTDPKQAVVGGDLQLPTGLHRLVLTPEGEQAARDGVASLFDKCLKAKKFRPKGCPFGVSDPPPGADESTVKWVAEGNPADEWSPSLRDDPTAVEGFLVYTLRLQFTYSQNGQTREYDRPAVLSQVFFVDLTTDPVGVTWEN